MGRGGACVMKVGRGGACVMGVGSGKGRGQCDKSG